MDYIKSSCLCQQQSYLNQFFRRLAVQQYFLLHRQCILESWQKIVNQVTCENMLEHAKVGMHKNTARGRNVACETDIRCIWLVFLMQTLKILVQTQPI
jgi:hypothetical protein